MRALELEPIRIEPTVSANGRIAFRALADVAATYLTRLDANSSNHSPRRAMLTRVRGTGPGVAFGDLIAAINRDLPVEWVSPFEGSVNVSGAPLISRALLNENRDDGFLLLRFAPHTQALPLHIHPLSDRFIYVIGGRGFFHVSDRSLEECDASSVRHVPARDRDVFMFRRGVVHTFSTAEHPLHLLSYHRPFISLDDDSQYAVGATPLTPATFLKGCRSAVSFDAAWTCLA